MRFTVFFLLETFWRRRLTARTQDFHSWNSGSIPGGATKIEFVKLSCRLTFRHYFYAAFLLLLMAGKNKVVVRVISSVW